MPRPRTPPASHHPRSRRNRSRPPAPAAPRSPPHPPPQPPTAHRARAGAAGPRPPWGETGSPNARSGMALMARTSDSVVTSRGRTPAGSGTSTSRSRASPIMIDSGSSAVKLLLTSASCSPGARSWPRVFHSTRVIVGCPVKWAATCSTHRRSPGRPPRPGLGTSRSPARRGMSPGGADRARPPRSRWASRRRCAAARRTPPDTAGYQPRSTILGHPSIRPRLT